MSKPSLLLVDKDPKSRRVLEVSLRKAGYEVALASSSTEAWDVFCQKTPDLVVSELVQEGIDGLALLRRAREESFDGVPFLFLAREGQVEPKKRALEEGASELLDRPFFVKEFITRVRLLLQRANRAKIESSQERTSFSGSLSDLGVVDLLQTLELGGKTGIITLENDGQKGEIFVRDGRVIDATLGRLSGEDAIYRMFLWTEGTYSGEFRNIRREERITLSAQGLILEGMRRLEEWTRLLDGLPPVHHVCEVDYSSLAERLGDLPDEVNAVLRLFDGHRSLLQVIDDAEFGPIETLTILGKLYAEGILYDTIQRPTRVKGIIPSPELERWLAGLPVGLPAAEEPTPNGLAAEVDTEKTLPAIVDAAPAPASAPPLKEEAPPAPKASSEEALQITVLQSPTPPPSLEDSLEEPGPAVDDIALTESDVPPPMELPPTPEMPVEAAPKEPQTRLISPSQEKEAPAASPNEPPPGALDTLEGLTPARKKQEDAPAPATEAALTAKEKEEARKPQDKLPPRPVEEPTPNAARATPASPAPPPQETPRDAAPKPLLQKEAPPEPQEEAQEEDDDDDEEYLPAQPASNRFVYAVMGVVAILFSSIVYMTFFNDPEEAKPETLTPSKPSPAEALSSLPRVAPEPISEPVLSPESESAPTSASAETLPESAPVLTEEDRQKYSEQIELAAKYYQEAKYDEALAAYQAALSFNPEGPEALTGVGAALFDQSANAYEAGKIEEAQALMQQSISQLTSVLKKYPDLPIAHFSLAIAYEYRSAKKELTENAQEDRQKAIQEYETYLKLAPEGPYAATAKDAIKDLSQK